MKDVLSLELYCGCLIGWAWSLFPPYVLFLFIIPTTNIFLLKKK